MTARETADGLNEVTVWVVWADDHDYDVMNQWLVGVYASEAEAIAASNDDLATYIKGGGSAGRYNATITETALRTPALTDADRRGEKSRAPDDGWMPINIIFDGPPSREGGRFVEVETDDGKSIRVGEWGRRPDGLWALRITQRPPLP